MKFSNSEKSIPVVKKSKYNKWYVPSSERFHEGMRQKASVRTKMFSPKDYPSVTSLKKSGFIPYFQLGEFDEVDLFKYQRMLEQKTHYD